MDLERGGREGSVQNAAVPVQLEEILVLVRSKHCLELVVVLPWSHAAVLLTLAALLIVEWVRTQLGLLICRVNKGNNHLNLFLVFPYPSTPSIRKRIVPQYPFQVARHK